MTKQALSARPIQILELLRDGASTAAVASVLGIEPDSVKSALHRAAIRLGARNRTHAVALAIQRGIISAHPGSPPCSCMHTPPAAPEPPSWLTPAASLGQRIWVSLVDGAVVSGRLVAVTSQGIALRVPGRIRQVPMSTIRSLHAAGEGGL